MLYHLFSYLWFLLELPRWIWMSYIVSISFYFVHSKIIERYLLLFATSISTQKPEVYLEYTVQRMQTLKLLNDFIITISSLSCEQWPFHVIRQPSLISKLQAENWARCAANGKYYWDGLFRPSQACLLTILTLIPHGLGLVRFSRPTMSSLPRTSLPPTMNCDVSEPKWQ